ncbi:acyl-CoA dehydrogenase [candidate division KSB1 bacterium]|nr:MAG: acyl-CoA dehydrogenase [candidate division KSB1 bacterium]
MIDFSLSEDQQQFRALAREFAQNEIRPVAAQLDEDEKFPEEVCRKAWELGLMNVHVPKEYGGLGLGVLEECLISEEIGWGCTGVGTTTTCNALAIAPVIVAGNDDQKKRFLTPLTKEFSFCSYAVTEPGAGSDVQAIKTTAKKIGNDYVITGQKMWITNAGHARWFFVIAYSDQSKGYKGISGFIVPADTPGVKIGKHEPKLGQRCSDTRGVTFEEAKIPAANLLGKEGDGWKAAMAAFDHSRPVVASMAVGLARAAMEHAANYAKERKTFGVPLAAHEGVSFMIADMAKDIEAARLLTWLAAWTIDQGKRNTLQAAYAKCAAADTAMRVATDAVQVFGGYGFSREYPVEKLMRDAKIFQIYEGTSQIQRLIIAKEIFERG